MEHLTIDKGGRLVLEKGLIRLFTDDLPPELTMLIVDFIKFLSDYMQTGTAQKGAGQTGTQGKIIAFPVK